MMIKKIINYLLMLTLIGSSFLCFGFTGSAAIQGTTDANITVEINGTTASRIQIQQEVNGVKKIVDERSIYGTETITLHQDDVGVYRYIIVQIPPGEAGVTYDTTQYYVDVYVMLEDDSIYTTNPVIYIANSMTKKDRVSFNNIVPTPTPAPSPTPNPSASPKPSSGTTPTACPDCVVNPDGTISSKTDDVNLMPYYLSLTGALLLPLILLGFYQKKIKE